MVQLPSGRYVLHNQRETEEGHDGATEQCEYPCALLDGREARSNQKVSDGQKSKGEPEGCRGRQPRQLGEEGDHRGGESGGDVISWQGVVSRFKNTGTEPTTDGPPLRK